MTSHTVTHCPHGLPLPGPCSLCADGLRAAARPPSVRATAARLGIPLADRGLPPDVVRPAPFEDDVIESTERAERAAADGLRAPGTDGADYHLGYLDGFAEALEGSLDGASPAWLGALLLLAALLMGAAAGWLLRGGL